MVDLGLLLLRLVTGPLMAGHGAQKLFGAFGGHGVQGTAGWLESLDMRPGRIWAVIAGLSELMSGTLVSLGLFHPIGSILMLGPMSTATTKAHWGKPIWVTSGGAELPVTNMAVATSLALAGPGRFSLDRLLGVRVPKTLAVLTTLATLGGIALAMTGQLEPVLTQVDETVSSVLQPSETTPSGAATEAGSGVPTH